MAVKNYRVNKGQYIKDVVKSTGSAITGNIEVNIDLATVDKKQAVLALKTIIGYILRDGFPPA